MIYAVLICLGFFYLISISFLLNCVYINLWLSLITLANIRIWHACFIFFFCLTVGCLRRTDTIGCSLALPFWATLKTFYISGKISLVSQMIFSYFLQWLDCQISLVFSELMGGNVFEIIIMGRVHDRLHPYLILSYMTRWHFSTLS